MESSKSLTKKNIVTVAGANGDLGHRIAFRIAQRGGLVRALVRKNGSGSNTLEEISKDRIEIIEVEYDDHRALVDACAGSHCVVSALSGLEPVIVDMQTKLLNAAVQAKVPRFIPSDYCIDYTKLKPGHNRNLDLRREFSKRLDKAPIAATSILNGMFTDLLVGPAPLILFGPKRIFFWGNADQAMDFTTKDNTADYTAAAALDSTTPRHLRIAGEVATARDLQRDATNATGKIFGLLRPGGLGLFRTMIKMTRLFSPSKDEVFPAWQGMQYLHDMLGGASKLNPLDNDRYPDIRWTSVREVLEKHVSAKG